MYRVALSSVFAAGLLLAGCSVNSGPMSYNDGASTGAVKSSTARRGVDSAALGGEPTAARTATQQAPASSRIKTAALNDKVPNDKAPAGSYEKAPPGALADRNYAATSLNAELARDLVNAYRQEKGLKPLKLDPALTEAAKAHSRDLAKWDRISHYGSDGSNPWDRVKRAGYNARVAAENVGTGQVDISEVFRGWKESPGHNKNLLLTDAEHMGIALVTDGKTEFKTFWTLVLGARM
jgi:uncharacterized protein YkwD